MIHHHSIQMAWEKKVEPEQIAFIEAAIEDASARGESLFEKTVKWELTRKVKQALIDLGYAVGERWVYERDGQRLLTVCWAPRGIRS
jgi:hypothetical protein